MSIPPFMETIGESVPPCAHTFDESVPAGTLVEPSPVEEAVIIDDSLLQLLNDLVDEPPIVASDLVDDHGSSVATTELDTSDDAPGDGGGVRVSSPDQQTTLMEVDPHDAPRLVVWCQWRC